MSAASAHALPPLEEGIDQSGAPSFAARHRKLLLGSLSVALFFAIWEALFLIVPLNTLFISKPSLIALGLVDLIATGDLARDLAVSAVPFLYGFVAAVLVGVALGVLMGWRVRLAYALDPLMTVFYASPLVALAPLVVVLFGVGVAGKAFLIFLLSVFPFIFNAAAGVRAVDPLLINVVRSLGGSERDLYLKVIVPSVLPYIIAHRHRACAHRGAGRGVLRRLGRHRLCHRALRRSVRARSDVRLHPDHHAHRGRVHGRAALGRAHRISLAGRAVGKCARRMRSWRTALWRWTAERAQHGHGRAWSLLSSVPARSRSCSSSGSSCLTC
jgi:NitT/TauT family transport system permease protein